MRFLYIKRAIIISYHECEHCMMEKKEEEIIRVLQALNSS